MITTHASASCVCARCRRELALIGDDLSMEDARLIFMWSRMRVIDEDDPKRRQRTEPTPHPMLRALSARCSVPALTLLHRVCALQAAHREPHLLGLPRGHRARRSPSSQCTQRVQCTTESAALCVCVVGARRPLQGDAHGGGGGGERLRRRRRLPREAAPRRPRRLQDLPHAERQGVVGATATRSARSRPSAFGAPSPVHSARIVHHRDRLRCARATGGSPRASPSRPSCPSCCSS